MLHIIVYLEDLLEFQFPSHQPRPTRLATLSPAMRRSTFKIIQKLKCIISPQKKKEGGGDNGNEIVLKKKKMSIGTPHSFRNVKLTLLTI